MRIGLMADVEYDPVARRVKYIMHRDYYIDCTHA